MKYLEKVFVFSSGVLLFVPLCRLFGNAVLDPRPRAAGHGAGVGEGTHYPHTPR
jgi:hypothetical protein